jgi:hypothetical protein
MSSLALKSSVEEGYARNETYVSVDVFKDGHLNDWKLIDLVSKSGSGPEEVEQAQAMVLESTGKRYDEEIQEKDILVHS